MDDNENSNPITNDEVASDHASSDEVEELDDDNKGTNS